MTGTLHVDEDVLRIIEHGVSLEIPYSDIIEVENGTFRSWISIKTKQGIKRKMVFPFALSYKKMAEEIRRRAGLE